jgi:ribosome-binding protein aMBF1 (putative translation factor)
MSNECEDYRAALAEARRKLGILKSVLSAGVAGLQNDIATSEQGLIEADKRVPRLEAWLAIVGSKNVKGG